MALAPLDSPPYVPEFPPQTPLVDVQMAQDWTKRELDKIARYTTAQPGTLYSPNNSPPTRPRTGMFTYADGVNWNPGSGEGLYIYKGGLWVPIGVGAGSRIRLSTATNFYYKPSTGSDSNPGTSTSPWASSAPLFSRYDFGGQSVMLNLQENTTSSLSISPWVGGGSLTVDLGAHSIATTNNHAIQTTGGSLPGMFTYQNGSLSTITSGNCVNHVSGGVLNQGTGLTFNACAGAHILAGFGTGNHIILAKGYTIAGGANTHLQVGSASVIEGETNKITVTFSGNPQFPGGWCFAAGGGTCAVDGLTFSGTRTGYPSGTALLAGQIFRNNGTAASNDLPGNGVVSLASGGIYQ